jgi:hypothetical protein
MQQQKKPCTAQPTSKLDYPELVWIHPKAKTGMVQHYKETTCPSYPNTKMISDATP